MTKEELMELMTTGEEFTTTTLAGTWKFIDNVICHKKVSGNFLPYDVSHNYFIGVTIIRKPWNPKIGERYWVWGFHPESHECEPGNIIFGADALEFATIAFGNYFRTREECEKHTEIRDKLLEMRKEYV